MRTLFTAAFLFIAAPALAQTATQVDRFTWGHTETAAVAQAFRFEIEIDGAAPVVLAGVTCTGAPTTCSARIPSVTPTQHVVRIRATDTTNAANPLVGPWSDPLTFTMRAVPSKPSAVGIIPGS